MTDSISARVWAYLAESAAGRGADMAVADVCATAVWMLAVSGSWVTAGGLAGSRHFMCVSDQVSEQLAELQLTLGEGPCEDVLRSDSPVLVPDLAVAEANVKWPAFAPQARMAGAAAIFALPFRLGRAAVSAGALAAYRNAPGPLSESELRDGLVLAEAAASLLVSSQQQPHAAQAAGSGPGGQSPALALRRSQIDQATGMVSEQLAISLADAFARLRDYAAAHHRSLSEVAREVVARRLTFTDDQGMPAL
jgi:hypothetical protein